MTVYPKRLIEVDLPIKRISAHARREKSIRHGHISTLHIWWARRPLAACRAVICASLWPDPADPICPQSFRDAASQLITEFAGKVFKTASLHDTVSPKSFGQWEGIVKAKEEGFAFDTQDSAHLNKLRFALLDFIADFGNWDNSTVPAYLETSRALNARRSESMRNVRKVGIIMICTRILSARYQLTASHSENRIQGRPPCRQWKSCLRQTRVCV